MSICFLSYKAAASAKKSHYGILLGFPRPLEKNPQGVPAKTNHKELQWSGWSQSRHFKENETQARTCWRALPVFHHPDATEQLSSSLSVEPKGVQRACVTEEEQTNTTPVSLSPSPSSSVGTACSVRTWTAYTEQPHISQHSHLQLVAALICAAHLEGGWPAFFTKWGGWSRASTREYATKQPYSNAACPQLATFRLN